MLFSSKNNLNVLQIAPGEVLFRLLQVRMKFSLVAPWPRESQPGSLAWTAARNSLNRV